MFRFSSCENLSAQQVDWVSSSLHHRGEQHLFLSPARCIIHNLLGTLANAGWENTTGDAECFAFASSQTLTSLTILNLPQWISNQLGHPSPPCQSPHTLLVKPDFFYETGIFQQRFHGYLQRLPVVSEPLSRSVSPPIFQAGVTLTIECLGGVFVIICPHAASWSSLVSSSWQLLWSSCLRGEDTGTWVYSPGTCAKEGPTATFIIYTTYLQNVKKKKKLLKNYKNQWGGKNPSRRNTEFCWFFSTDEG